MSVLETYQSKFKGNERENFNFMVRMIRKGFKAKGIDGDEWYEQRLQEELKVIKDAYLEDFFLNTSYICALIDDAGIFRGPARGSVLASVVAYGLNITKIPPKPYNLSFSRFLNATRVQNTLPDIDTDVSSDQREEVIQLIRHAFGEEYCGQIITKLKYTPKMLIKDLASAMGIDFATVNKVTAQLSPDEDYHDNVKVMNFLEKYPMIKNNIDPLTGLVKSYGKHPGAVIIFDDIKYGTEKLISTNLAEFSINFGFISSSISNKQTFDVNFFNPMADKTETKITTNGIKRSDYEEFILFRLHIVRGFYPEPMFLQFRNILSQLP